MNDINLTFERFGDQALRLGRVGENRATRILVNLKSILSQYPNAIASITAKQPAGKEYPAVVKQEGSILTWEITKEDIGNKAGNGQAQITIQDADGTIIKTAIATTRVAESLGSPQSPAPDPVKGWVANAEEILADVERSGTAAQKIADEVKHKLDAGELTGAPGRDGIDGKPGKDGAAGATGATPQIKAEAVTGEPGTQVSVTQSGTPENPILSFKIPRGDRGERGAKGAPGEPGKDAPQEAVLYTAQTLDDAQKAQARENIGAADAAQQNVLVGSETGNPIAVDDAFAAPLCGLTVYGKSTQDGTPSPDNPAPIVSAGDGGSVAVKVTGKNLLYIPDGVKTVRGVTITSKNGRISISGTATENGYVYLPVKQISIHGLALLSSNVSDPVAKLVSESWEVLFVQGKANVTQGVITRVCFIVKEGTNYDSDGINVQLELGTTATAYSPYREQLLTLPTPNGLPGIPVTSGGNYTDENGQQWVCDEVDLERGVKVQRVTTMVFSDSLGFVAESTDNGIRFNRISRELKKADTTTPDSGAFCSALALGRPGSTWNTPNVFSINIKLYIRLKNITSLGELQQYLQQTPMSLTAILATPVETPLTPAELTAYKALTTYAPNTVVQAMDGAGLKLDYQRDVNIVIKNLEDAIASMTTT